MKLLQFTLNSFRTRQLFYRSMSSNSLKIGQSFSVIRLVSKEDTAHFSQLSGDFNSVHQGTNAVVHGAFLNALVSGVLGTQLPGPGCMVVSQIHHYPNPCYVNETVSISVTVTGLKADLIKCSYNITVQSDNEIVKPRTVLSGSASLIMIKDQQKRLAKNKEIPCT